MTNMLMLQKIFLLYLNIFAIKLALSQTIYNASPTCSYPPASVSAVPSYPIASATASTVTVTATPLPASSIASSIPTMASCSSIAVAASPIPISASPIPVTASPKSVAASSIPVAVSPLPSTPTGTTEAKAYFVPGPVPDPKVTVLGDIPAVVEVTPKIYPDSPSAFPDPGYIEVKATICKDGVPSSIVSTSKTGKDNSPLAPVKRLTMACANDDPFLAAYKTPLLASQPVCPGISKMDLLPTLAEKQDKNNPIDFGGLLDSFMTCL